MQKNDLVKVMVVLAVILSSLFFFAGGANCDDFWGTTSGGAKTVSPKNGDGKKAATDDFWSGSSGISSLDIYMEEREEKRKQEEARKREEERVAREQRAEEEARKKEADRITREQQAENEAIAREQRALEAAQEDERLRRREEREERKEREREDKKYAEEQKQLERDRENEEASRRGQEFWQKENQKNADYWKSFHKQRENDRQTTQTLLNQAQKDADHQAREKYESRQRSRDQDVRQDNDRTSQLEERIRQLEEQKRRNEEARQQRQAELTASRNRSAGTGKPQPQASSPATLRQSAAPKEPIKTAPLSANVDSADFWGTKAKTPAPNGQAADTKAKTAKNAADDDFWGTGSKAAQNIKSNSIPAQEGTVADRSRTFPPPEKTWILMGTVGGVEAYWSYTKEAKDQIRLEMRLVNNNKYNANVQLDPLFQCSDGTNEKGDWAGLDIKANGEANGQWAGLINYKCQQLDKDGAAIPPRHGTAKLTVKAVEE